MLLSSVGIQKGCGLFLEVEKFAIGHLRLKTIKHLKVIWNISFPSDHRPSEELANTLLEKARVAVVAGSGFGADFPNFSGSIVNLD